MEQISGKIERVAGNGFILAGREGWLNVSKYASDVHIPPVGMPVMVGVDKSGFVRKIELGAVDTPRTKTPPVVAGASEPPAVGMRVDRETAIGRMAALNTAVAVLGGGPGSAVDPAEVVKLAGRLEAWVHRPG